MNEEMKEVENEGKREGRTHRYTKQTHAVSTGLKVHKGLKHDSTQTRRTVEKHRGAKCGFSGGGESGIEVASARGPNGD